jgi:sarcosine oxidase
MSEAFDILVIGLGANGSSALYHLSKTNKSVAGIDRFAPPHLLGSSHGQSRIIRQAYYESPLYVPFVKEAYTYWNELEKVSGKELLLKTGGLMLGTEESSVIAGSRVSAETHQIEYEYLQPADLRKRFPAFKPEPGTVGVLEKEAGILFPEECIRAYLAQAQKNGADIRTNETVLQFIPGPDKVEVTTSKGSYTAEKCIISAGAWTGGLVPGLHLPLTVARQALYWFKNADTSRQSHLMPQTMPIFIWEYLPGKMFYGFPDLGNGLKIARHHAGEPVKPDELTQAVSQGEIDDMKTLADTYLNMEPVFSQSAVCMYTNTPDGDFIIDTHPDYKNIVIASPCSGHGFKFSSLTGKILSELATDQKPDLDISPFSITRPYAFLG